MKTADSTTGSIALASDSVGGLLEAFRYVLPHVECHGLYAINLDATERRARSIACLRLRATVAEHWSMHYKSHPISEAELAGLRNAVR